MSMYKEKDRLRSIAKRIQQNRFSAQLHKYIAKTIAKSVIRIQQET